MALGSSASSPRAIDVIPKELFASAPDDFAHCIEDSTENKLAPAAADEFQIQLCTLSGVQHVLDGVTAATTIEEVKRRAADLVSAPPFAIKLMHGMEMLTASCETLGGHGLDKPDSLLTIVRCAATRAEYTMLFSQLVRAMENGCAAEARRLVDQGAGFDAEGNVLKASPCGRMRSPGDCTVDDAELGNTMLHLAIRHGFEQLALYLISKGVESNTRNDAGRSPLMLAIIKKQASVIEALLEQAGVDLKVQDYMGKTALVYALRNGNDRVAARLVACLSRKPDQVGFSWHHTPTEAAQVFASLPPLQLDDAALSSVLSGTDPVVTCCGCGFPLTAMALLQDGANPHGSDSLGRQALHYAYALDEQQYGCDRTAIIEALLAKGAGDMQTDQLGNLPACGLVNPKVSLTLVQHAASLTSRCSFKNLIQWKWKF